MAQTTYEQQSDRPLPFGALADGGPVDIISRVNSSPGASQLDTMTIINYVALKVLNWTIDGVAFTYTMTVADADVTGVAHAIAAQMQAEPIFGGRFVATHLAGVISLTARFAGVGWTLVATGANAADNAIANSTANAAASALPYGRLVVDDGQIAGTADLQGKLASATVLTAQVVTGTPNHEDVTIYSVDVECKGIRYHCQYDSTAGHTVANICAALLAQVNAIMPAQTVIASGGVTELTLTSELAGLGFKAIFGTNLSPATWVVTDTALATDDVNEAALGIAMRSDSIETNSDTVPGYPANRTCSILHMGRIVVQTPSLVVASRGVWVRLAGGTAASPLGSFRDTAASDCVELDRQRFRWVRGASVTRAVLQVNAD